MKKGINTCGMHLAKFPKQYINNECHILLLYPGAPIRVPSKSYEISRDCYSFYQVANQVSQQACNTRVTEGWWIISGSV